MYFSHGCMKTNGVKDGGGETKEGVTMRFYHATRGRDMNVLSLAKVHNEEFSSPALGKWSVGWIELDWGGAGEIEM